MKTHLLFHTLKLECVFLCLILALSLIGCETKKSFNGPDSMPSSIGTSEDPAARFNYEMKFLVDPINKEVPTGVFRGERVFVNEIANAVSNARTEVSSWESKGPNNIGGRTRALASDIRDDNIVMAGSATGALWRSIDQGKNWRLVSTPNVVNGVTTLVQDTRLGKEDTWYYGTGELAGNSASAGLSTPFRGDGIFKSVDNGLTWSPLKATVTNDESELDSPFNFVMKIAINTANLTQDEIFAAVLGGIVRSVDGGETWSVVLNKYNLPRASFNDILTDKSPRYTDLVINNNGVMHATFSSLTIKSGYDTSIPGVFRSLNGIDWEDITPVGYFERRSRAVLGVRKSKDQLYVFVESGSGHQLFKFFGDEKVWVDLSTNLPEFTGSGELNTQGSYNMLLKVHPVNQETVFLGATNLYRSTDAFRSKVNVTWIGGYNTDGTFEFYGGHHPDQHVLHFLQSNPTKAISGTDGGVHLTSNILGGSVSWKEINDGYVSSQFYAVNQDKNTFSLDIIGGMQDNGTALKTTGEKINTWQEVISGDGGYCYVVDNGNTLYVSFQFANIFRLKKGTSTSPSSFARIDPLLPQRNESSYDFVNPFIIDPDNFNRMYLVQRNTIYRNDDLSRIPNSNSEDRASVGWGRLNYINGDPITAIEIPESSPSKLYYGTATGQLHEVRNPQGNSGRRRDISGSEFPSGVISSISVNPVNEDDIALVFSNYNIPSIFLSLDRGESFQDISGNLEENQDGTGNGPSVRWIEIVPVSGKVNKYFVGTSSGVFSTINPDGEGTVWVKEGEEEMGRSVVKMMSYRRLDGRLLVATHGNGIFETFVDGEFIEVKGGIKLAIRDVYPNPVDIGGSFQAEFSLPEDGDVTFALYSQEGERIGESVTKFFKKGSRSIRWNQSPKGSGVCHLVIAFKKETTSTKLIYRQ